MRRFLELHCTSRPLLWQTDEFNVEDMSETKKGAQDEASSSIEVKQVGLNLTAGNISNIHPKFDMENTDHSHPHLPYRLKDVESCSMPGSSIFDHGNDEIIELPSLNSISPQYLMLLQPAPDTQSSHASRCQSFQSAPPTPKFTNEKPEIFVAKQVTFVKPTTKPNLIQINPTRAQAGNTGCAS